MEVEAGYVKKKRFVRHGARQAASGEDLYNWCSGRVFGPPLSSLLGGSRGLGGVLANQPVSHSTAI